MGGVWFDPMGVLTFQTPEAFFSLSCETRDRGGGGVQIEKNSLSRLTPPFDKVLPTTTGVGGGGEEVRGCKSEIFSLKTALFPFRAELTTGGGEGCCQRVFSMGMLNFPCEVCTP